MLALFLVSSRAATAITTTAGADTITFTSSDTTAAAADAYVAGGAVGPAAGAWAGPAPPTSVEEALDRIAIYLATHVSPTVGGALP